MARYLLDTHAAIWFFNGDDRLSKTAKEVILDTFNQIHLSIASVWEVAIKTSLGKLSFGGGASGFIRLAEDNGFTLLPIEAVHIIALENLPYHHRDPFDRILIAASLSERMSFISSDRNMVKYGISLTW
ncbi:twitching motility protein PilT [Spirochaetia bacterium]|nr:twitching motility protein PilT [Spirochaetia bacterium]